MERLGGLLVALAIFGACSAPPSAKRFVTIDITGDGVVRASDGRVCHASSCQWEAKAPLTVTAEPAAGALFGGFGGACSGKGPCVVSEGRVTAAFVEAGTLEIEIVGSGSGTVRDDTGVIDCAQSCTVTVPRFSAWSLRAISAPGSLAGTFDEPGWGSSCLVTAPAHVVARFERGRPVTVSLSGSGSGTVSLDGNVLCPGACSALVPTDAGLRFEAWPSETSNFLGFDGGCSGTGPCAVPPGTDPVVVSARFDSALVWARSFPIFGDIGTSSAATAILADDAGIVATVAVSQGIEVDGVPFRPGVTNGAAMVLSLDWDGRTVGFVPMVSSVPGTVGNGLTALVRDVDGALYGFGSCGGGDFAGQPCPPATTASLHAPLMVRFGDGGVVWARIDATVAGGSYVNAQLSAGAMFAEYTGRPTNSTSSFGVSVTPADGGPGSIYEAPFGGTAGACGALDGVTCAVPVRSPDFNWQGCSFTDAGTGFSDLALVSVTSTGECTLHRRFHSISSNSYFGERALVVSGTEVVLAGLARDDVDLGPSSTGYGSTAWILRMRGGAVTSLAKHRSSGTAIDGLAVGRTGLLAVGMTNPNSSFFGRPAPGLGTFVATFDPQTTLRRFWWFPNGRDVTPRIATLDGKIVLLMVGSDVSFDGKKLAPDSQQRLHILVLQE